MKKEEVQSILETIDKKKFTSNAHTYQTRIFGYITTNIRTPRSISVYIEDLLPEYIKRKNNLVDWEKWATDTSDENKQKFKRLEVAKILFRKIQDSPKLNDIGEKLYNISNQRNGNAYLTFILNLYLLTGRYFDVANQPLVEISKILASYNGDILEDSKAVLIDKSINRLVLACIFYNPSVPKALDLAYELLQDSNISSDTIEYLSTLAGNIDSLLNEKIRGAGGINNFRYDVATILNYHLFKTVWLKNIEDLSYEDTIKEYIDLVFEHNLNEYYKIKSEEKPILLQILQDPLNNKLLKDVVEFASGIKFKHDSFVRRVERKNIKQTAFEKYNYKCFFHYFSQNRQECIAHKLTYFNTKKNQTYLEGHHMVQMENSKFFEKDVDVVENVIPVCPNCHRKLHSASSEIVKEMLKIYDNNSDKKERMRKGIFVDIDTLSSFYGIENN